MEIKARVLEMLENNIGNSISGEEIAKELSISRNSVWKAINSLKNDGYKINAQTKRGYELSTENDLFTASSIKKHLKRECEILIYDEIDSSNNTAKKLAQAGMAEGTLIIAKKQTSGKGRMGRSFISNEENGLYMSLILRPTIPANECIDITVIGAVAVAEAIEATSNKKCSIKWVNDVFVDDKKACGILTEASVSFESASLDYVVLGIGINVTEPKNGFNDEIKDIAGAVLEKNIVGYKSRLCAEIINRFFDYYNEIKNREFINIYKSKSNIIGKDVSVYRGNEIVNGTCIDIDDNANLVVKSGEKIFKFSSGEARARKQ